MHIILGSDHGGFELKEKIKAWLVGEGHEIDDAGAPSFVSDDDYTDYAKAAIKKAGSNGDRVVLFCKNGFGMSIAANRFIGVRCGVAFNEEAVRKGRTDDDINCLSVPAMYINEENVRKMINIFLEESFSLDERYVRRIMKLDNTIS